MTDCTHHWLIGDARQGVSEGQCKLCGAWRTFKNPHADWATRGNTIKLQPLVDRHTMADER